MKNLLLLVLLSVCCLSTVEAQNNPGNNNLPAGQTDTVQVPKTPFYPEMNPAISNPDIKTQQDLENYNKAVSYAFHEFRQHMSSLSDLSRQALAKNDAAAAGEIIHQMQAQIDGLTALRRQFQRAKGVSADTRQEAYNHVQYIIGRRLDTNNYRDTANTATLRCILRGACPVGGDTIADALSYLHSAYNMRLSQPVLDSLNNQLDRLMQWEEELDTFDKTAQELIGAGQQDIQTVQQIQGRIQEACRAKSPQVSLPVADNRTHEENMAGIDATLERIDHENFLVTMRYLDELDLEEAANLLQNPIYGSSPEESVKTVFGPEKGEKLLKQLQHTSTTPPVNAPNH